MKTFSLVAVCALLLGLATSFAQETKTSKTEAQSIKTEVGDVSIVLDLERPSETDIILMRNGDKLTGTVLNESFSIRTSYASLTFNNRIIAGIDLEGGANNIEAIVTVNNNRFSGFIDDPVVVFKHQSGTKIEIRREKILKIIFRVREAERRGIPQTQFVILKNGDYFSGKILNKNLIIATTYAKVPLDLDGTESVTMIGGDSPLTKVLMRNSDVIQGVLETEDINIALDIGNEVGIYQDRINILYCREGFIPDLSMVRTHGIVSLTTAHPDYDYKLAADRSHILITSVPSTSRYHGHLQARDRIVALDGIPYAKVPERRYKGKKGRLFPLCGELMDGKRSHITLTVSRGDKTFMIRLVKK